ncbi:ESX secretion-associated protein EspG [Kutzneria viridogrisea]|uniref:ESX secretion-associated protein EspG n=2 Tax=Kutzneria TaxID=43356 RepID=W5VY80_9PSEU|nr:ESX secretion-associated protein EspG [Kutzneria albida]AHH93838.1 hypothetical protein KALB_462 [Kutzneria albida DSM 43870]MBA8931157.1 hypothetical protein [Kutzneria viridogrisea]
MSTIAILPLAAFDILWADLRLGSVPYPFEVPSHGETLDERARIRGAVYADLQERRLVTDRQLDPDLEDALRLLRRPYLQLDTISTVDNAQGVMLRAAAVAHGQRAVLAVQQDRAIRLDYIRDTAMAASLVGLLPPTPAAPGEPVSLPAAQVAAPGQRVNGWAEPGGSSATEQQQALSAILASPVLRLGQIAGATFDQQGNARRLPGLSWFDTEAGRYVGVLGRGRDGQQWATVAPADGNRLVHRLGEMIRLASRV